MYTKWGVGETMTYIHIKKGYWGHFQCRLISTSKDLWKCACNLRRVSWWNIRTFTGTNSNWHCKPITVAIKWSLRHGPSFPHRNEKNIYKKKEFSYLSFICSLCVSFREKRRGDTFPPPSFPFRFLPSLSLCLCASYSFLPSTQFSLYL